MAGAAALSLGMVGTFSIPAYATNETPAGVNEVPDGFLAAQTLQTSTAAPVANVVVDAEGSEATAVAAEKKKAADKAEADAEKAEQLAEQQAADAAAPAEGGAPAAAGEAPEAPQEGDVPPGSGAQGIVDAALAQLGVNQDCTALVEKSLRAVGIPAGDLGTQVHEYTALGGTVVTSGSYAPGDILVFPGQHVGVYIGNGQAVHGGWGGTTRIGPIAPGGETGLTVVRF
ncbi:NlpC/P60 family protein [Leucobacter chromiiresistens]|uniref:Cell wall-associated hydrolase, NlpC family n=1 Tax=Leucobacter chromiiresistens TaxID=1079994 RepID=A0A1H0XR32_9MICO|nr:NlpC/P60 family protein [Leucobacter chromiiresistens]SDQ05377.1 Cell wall-associated hydrolase, NlpC family [Leucobacter chromiiresistens]